MEECISVPAVVLLEDNLGISFSRIHLRIVKDESELTTRVSAFLSLPPDTLMVSLCKSLCYGILRCVLPVCEIAGKWEGIFCRNLWSVL